MIICVKCRRIMKCVKNGVGADFEGGHVYAADKFSCPECRAAVLHTNSAAGFDPDYKLHHEYLKVQE